MAEVISMGHLLPLGALFVGVHYLSSRKGAQAPERHTPTEDQMRREVEMLDLHQNGANASVFANLHDKSFRMGGTDKEVVGVDFTGGGYNPNSNVDPLEAVFAQHADLSAWDRDDTFLSLVVTQGEIRMRHRPAIVATLTPEIHRPNDPAAESQFAMYQGVPNWANAAQIAQIKRNKDPHLEPSAELMRYSDTEFFGRAPGQSFRYE